MVGRGVPAGPVVPAGGPALVGRTVPVGVVLLEQGEPVPGDPWWDLSVPGDPLDGWTGGQDRGPSARPPVTVDDLVGTRAGPDLAWLVDTVDGGSSDDGLLVELVAACERLAAWAHGVSALAAGRLARRSSMSPGWSPSAGVPNDPCVAADELALRLAWSRRAASRLVRDGRAFTGALAPTADALLAGRLDRIKARVLVERLDRVGLPVAVAVQDRVLAGADRRTPTQLALDTERALLVVDPADTADRVTRARATRRVDHARALPDGMAGMWAVLPADQAVLMDTTLDTMARALRANGDPRTVDQLRADTLVRLTLTDRDEVDRCRREPGAVTRTGTRRSLGAPPPDRPGPGPAAGGRGRVVPPTPHINVTVGLSTLLGVDELPAELDRYGPIPATQARALAAGGIWRRIITDPMTGTVLDVGRTRYTPPADIDRHVRTRDHTCARPGCPTPATTCDLDHTIPFHAGAGPQRTTAADNLGPLCRRDHRLKTDGGYHLTQPAPGVFDWTTPTGHTYRCTPGTHGQSRLTHIPEHPPPPPRTTRLAHPAHQPPPTRARARARARRRSPTLLSARHTPRGGHHHRGSDRRYQTAVIRPPS